MLQTTSIPSDEPALHNPSAGMTGKVVRGSLWSLVGQGIVAVASLIATPFTIRLLGTEAYGVLTLVNLIIGYLAFADLGMGAASTRFGSDAYARADADGEAATVWTALIVSLIPSLLAALALVLVAGPFVVHVLHLPTTLHGPAILAFRIAALGFLARTVAGVINTPQLIRLRMDLYTTINTSGVVAQVILVPVALFMGGGLVTAVALTTVMVFITCFAHAVASTKLQPRILQPAFRWALALPLARFGSTVVLSYLVAMLLLNADKVILARLSTISTLAHYAIAFTSASLLTALPIAMSQSLFPAFTQLHSIGDQDALQRLCTRAMDSILLWVAPAVVFAFLLAEPFFNIWAGKEFGRESTLPFYILIGGLVFNIAAYIPINLILAWGKPGRIVRFNLLELIPYLICSAILIHLWGAVGAALGWSLRVIVDAGLLFRSARKLTELSFSVLHRRRYGFVIAFCCLTVPVALAVGFLGSVALQVAIAIPSVVAYFMIVWLKVLNNDEKKWFKGGLTRVLPFSDEKTT